MKRSLLALIAIVSFAASASAADIPARMPVKAPAYVEPAPTWTGFYVGAHLGWGWVKQDATPTNLVPFPDRVGVNLNSDGFLGGGQIGFNYQFANNWVIGVEADGSWTDSKTSVAIGPVVLPPTAVVTTTLGADTKWFATATGRLGYTWGPGLLYVKGGAAWMHAEYTAAQTGLLGGLPFLFADIVTHTRTGWTVGAGLEYALAANWSAKFEYDYMDFGSERYFLPATGATLNVDTQVHQVKAGINYRFPWGR